MYYLIERYINKMKMEDVLEFAYKKNINLSEDELIFTYNFIKKNYKQVLSNPKTVNFERFKDKYSQENYKKIVNLFNEYFIKYHNYL